MILPGHPALASYPVVDGCLQVGGLPLTTLAQQIGQTPFYVYERRRLDDRITHLRRYLPSAVKLHYAIKANPMPAIVQHLARVVDGFDVASAQEMELALNAPLPARHISFAGPGKTGAELAQAIDAGVRIEIESAREMHEIARFAKNSERTPLLAVRINPDFEVKGSGMRMGGGPQQFGVDSEEVSALLHQATMMGLKISGLHVFAGSQNLRADILQDIQTRTVELALKVSAQAPAPIEYINIGGGFGIPYFPKDVPLDIAPIGENLNRLVDDRLRPALPQAQVVIELGRYIVGECGLYVTRVIDRKVSRGQVFLVTDGGLHHQLAASGNFGQVIRRNYPVAIANRMNQMSTETVNVVGCLCTPLDLLADKVELPIAEVGDFVVIFQSGAYGLTASPVNFLSHPVPPEILV